MFSTHALSRNTFKVLTKPVLGNTLTVVTRYSTAPSAQFARSYSTALKDVFRVTKSTTFAKAELPMAASEVGWMQYLGARGYATRSRFTKTSRRKVDVAEQERLHEQSGTQTQWGVSPRVGSKDMAYDDRYDSASRREDTQQRVRQMDDISEGALAHMRKVYATMGSAFGIAAGGAMLSLTTPLGAISPLIMGLGSLAPLIGLYMTDERTSSQNMRLGLFGGFSLMSGAAMAPLLKMAAMINPWNIPLALGLTGGIFAGATAVSMFAPKGSYLKYGSALGGGALVLFGAGIAAIFTPYTSPFYPILHNVWLYGGLGIMSAFVSYDTQRTLDEYEHGERDVLKQGINMFINMKGIFVRVLSILSSRD
eukprot:GFYU01000771.1.p1 GENE.GFYU01000771.1~~GFYU01000771.1.p1  ORF type:complete len:366 (+),score=94.23 GFYU01000771.1:31-1128(+)